MLANRKAQIFLEVPWAQAQNTPRWTAQVDQESRDQYRPCAHTYDIDEAEWATLKPCEIQLHTAVAWQPRSKQRSLKKRSKQVTKVTIRHTKSRRNPSKVRPPLWKKLQLHHTMDCTMPTSEPFPNLQIVFQKVINVNIVHMLIWTYHHTISYYIIKKRVLDDAALQCFFTLPGLYFPHLRWVQRLGPTQGYDLSGSTYKRSWKSSYDSTQRKKRLLSPALSFILLCKHP